MRRISWWLLAGAGAVTCMVFGCAPDFVRAVFVCAKHPDLPRKRFVAGQLGILQPTYARSYLFVAYRYLAQAPLNGEEQAKVLRYYEDRDTAWWDAKTDEWTDRWITARRKVPGAGDPIADHRNVWNRQTYSYDEKRSQWYLNCADDALRTAIHTLDARIQRFGLRSPIVKDWLHTQDQVFGNCSGRTASIPEPAALDLPPLAQADRAYQIAAAHFYAGNLTEAEARFRHISNESASPWRPLAPYLVARILLREAEFGPDKTPARPELLEKAEKQLEEVLRDPATPVRGSARLLLNRVRYRSKPDELLHELAISLSRRNAGESMRQELWDYTTLMDTSGMRAIKRDDMTDWIFTFQSASPEARGYAVAKWRQGHSLPWLLAAIAQSRGKDLDADVLIQAGSTIPPDSPAFATASYHIGRLLIERGNRQQARERIADLLDRYKAEFPPSATNLLHSRRMQAAPDLSGFLALAPRVPLMLTDTMDEADKPSRLDWYPHWLRDAGIERLDYDAVKRLNERLPLRVLQQAVLSNALPSHLQRELARATFTRAAILGDYETARAVTPSLRLLVPKDEKLLDGLEAAHSDDEASFAAVFLILHHPEARPYMFAGIPRQTADGRIDDFRDNWWCAVVPDLPLDAVPSLKHYAILYPKEKYYREPRDCIRQTAIPTPDFLGAEDENIAKIEVGRLRSLPTGPNYLSGVVVHWVASHSDDPRAAEALHLAVKSTRYGCTDRQTWRFSKQAFDLLHRRYGKTTWAKKTHSWWKEW